MGRTKQVLKLDWQFLHHDTSIHSSCSALQLNLMCIPQDKHSLNYCALFFKKDLASFYANVLLNISNKFLIWYYLSSPWGEDRKKILKNDLLLLVIIIIKHTGFCLMYLHFFLIVDEKCSHFKPKVFISIII